MAYNDLPTVRERLIESFDLPQVSKALGQAYRENPKMALSMGTFWLRREKHKADITFCPLERVMGKADGPIMKALFSRLHAEELNSLRALADELTNPILKSCANTYLKAMGTPASKNLLKMKKAVNDSTAAYFSVGDFCPQDSP